MGLTKIDGNWEKSKAADISLDYYKTVTNHAANNIFQIMLKTCLQASCHAE